MRNPIHFPTTRWLLVLRAGGEAGESRLALGQLLRRYVRPLRAYLVYTRGISPDAADDLVQGFIADRVLERSLVAAADPARGRFRTFLLCALDRYQVDRLRHERRLKRRTGGRLMAIEAAGELAGKGGNPQAIFEVEWARGVLERALQSMQDECTAGGRCDLWLIFEGRVLGPALAGEPPAPYAQLTQGLGLPAPEHGPNLLVTAKRMFQRALRRTVGEYAEEGEVDAEIAELEKILSRSG